MHATIGQHRNTLKYVYLSSIQSNHRHISNRHIWFAKFHQSIKYTNICVCLCIHSFQHSFRKFMHSSHISCRIFYLLFFLILIFFFGFQLVNKSKAVLRYRLSFFFSRLLEIYFDYNIICFFLKWLFDRGVDCTI